ncbi:response regulator transcription factor [Mangrovivirga sp. M17]|uniref:Response regulator transcription factor n=1 Tax=Mangrovivirga halotolerans TaxID=2993936 RepID=A0ABT3RSX5_9BACT|nr:response regulator transcription factor [Mangrovivirga halotolerans]
MNIKNTNIIIADDHALFRKGLSSLVKITFDIPEIREAGGGKELIKLIEEDKPDLILLDLNMPNMDGVDAASFIINNYPDIKILVISMFDDERYVHHMMEMGANGYILKNAEPDEVEKAISNVLKYGYYFNDLVNDVVKKGFGKSNTSNHFGFKDNINLTQREAEILILISKEYTNSEIADKIHLSPRTVEAYRQELLKKIGAKNTAGLVKFAVKNKLID